jgi:hypothetical protein
MIKKFKGVSRKEFLFRFTDLWNILQKKEYRLTDKEAWILVEFMSLAPEYDKFRFSSQCKKMVMKEVVERGWDVSIMGVNQLLAKLEQKKILRIDEDKCRYLRDEFKHFLDPKNTKFTFTFDFDIDNEL